MSLEYPCEKMDAVAIGFIILFAVSAIFNLVCCVMSFRAWNFCRNCGGNRRMYGERRLGSPMRCTTCKKRDDVKFVWCYNNLTWKVCASNGPAVGVRAENVIGVPAEGLQHWTATVADPEAYYDGAAPPDASAATIFNRFYYTPPAYPAVGAEGESPSESAGEQGSSRGRSDGRRSMETTSGSSSADGNA